MRVILAARLNAMTGIRCACDDDSPRRFRTVNGHLMSIEPNKPSTSIKEAPRPRLLRGV
jgi:hypothetical protein